MASPQAMYLPQAITHDTKADAEQLHKAMKGIGTDEGAIIKVLANRKWEERADIISKFHQLYQKDLIKEIKSETSGNFEKTLVALLTEPAIFDVETVHTACEGAGTNENALIEVFVTRSNAQKNRLNALYTQIHGKSLKHVVEKETSGDFKKCLKDLLEPRDESWVVDAAAATLDAERLYKAGEGKIGTNEDEFISILTKRNFLQIREIAKIYELNHKKHSLEKAIDSEFSGSLRTVLLAIVTFSINSYNYFAQILHKSMEGVGTNDAKLIRTIVYCQPFIGEVAKAYHALFGKSLHHHISEDCSGDYKKLLLEIVH